MRNLILLSLCGFCLGFSACDRGNQEACEQYLATANLEYERCDLKHLVKNRIDYECPAWLDTGGADCTQYYDCLRRTVVCCTEARQLSLQTQGDDCELGEIDFAAMEACTGCR